MLLLAVIAALISSAYGQARYVIDDYTLPNPTTFAPEPRNWAYPLELCVNLGVSGLAPTYGIFACNQAGDTVTLSNYGTDSTCTGTVASTKDITDTTLFRCVGEDNYVSSVACTRDARDENDRAFGGPACCQEESTNLLVKGCLTTSIATGICYSPDNDGNYTTASCDEFDETLGIYSDDVCSVKKEIVNATAIDDCSFLLNLGALDTYRKMNACVEDGVDLANDTYCPYITPMPTSEPTEMTMNPTTAEPTANPTTAAPTEIEDESKAAAGLYVASLLIAVIGFAVYM